MNWLSWILRLALATSKSKTSMQLGPKSDNATTFFRFPSRQNELRKDHRNQDPIKSFLKGGKCRKWARQERLYLRDFDSVSIFQFDNVCMFRNKTQRTLLVNNKSLDGVVLQNGTWGPWPGHQPLRLAVWSDLWMRQIDEVTYEEHSVYELFLGLKYSRYNVFHSFIDISGLASIFWTLQKAITGQLELLAPQFSAEDNSFEISAVRSMCGNCSTRFRPPRNSQSPLICYRRVFVPVFDNLVQSQPSLKNEFGEDTELVISIRPEIAWAQTLRLPPVQVSAGELPRIVIIDRVKSRRLLNLGFVVDEMKKMGWSVTTVQLEHLSLEEQFSIIRNATTLIGVHGAGLSWGRYLHEDAALIQLVGFPCEFESHSRMDFRPRYKMVPANARATSTYRNTSSARIFCDLLTRFTSHKFPPTANFSTKLDLANFSDSEAATLMDRPLDVRKYDVVVDIPLLLDAVTQLDVAASSFTYPDNNMYK